jgi:hypothetical protein
MPLRVVETMTYGAHQIQVCEEKSSSGWLVRLYTSHGVRGSSSCSFSTNHPDELKALLDEAKAYADAQAANL